MLLSIFTLKRSIPILFEAPRGSDMIRGSMQPPKLCRTLTSPKFCLILLLIWTSTVAAKASTPDERARQTLEQALQTHGGLERHRALNSLFFKGKGSEFRSTDLQGPDTSTPIKTFHEETIAAFPSQEKILYEQRTGRHDGSFRWRRWMYAGEERTAASQR